MMGVGLAQVASRDSREVRRLGTVLGVVVCNWPGSVELVDLVIGPHLFRPA